MSDGSACLTGFGIYLIYTSILSTHGCIWDGSEHIVITHTPPVSAPTHTRTESWTAKWSDHLWKKPDALIYSTFVLAGAWWVGRAPQIAYGLSKLSDRISVSETDGRELRGLEPPIARFWRLAPLQNARYALQEPLYAIKKHVLRKVRIVQIPTRKVGAENVEYFTAKIGGRHEQSVLCVRKK